MCACRDADHFDTLGVERGRCHSRPGAECRLVAVAVGERGRVGEGERDWSAVLPPFGIVKVFCALLSRRLWRWRTKTRVPRGWRRGGADVGAALFRVCLGSAASGGLAGTRPARRQRPERRGVCWHPIQTPTCRVKIGMQLGRHHADTKSKAREDRHVCQLLMGARRQRVLGRATGAVRCRVMRCTAGWHASRGSCPAHKGCVRDVPDRRPSYPFTHTKGFNDRDNKIKNRRQSTASHHTHPRPVTCRAHVYTGADTPLPMPKSLRCVGIEGQHPPLGNGIRQPVLVDEYGSRFSSTGRRAFTTSLNDYSGTQRCNVSAGSLHQRTKVVVGDVQSSAPANGQPVEQRTGRPCRNPSYAATRCLERTPRVGR